jgi:hypothetical protein
MGAFFAASVVFHPVKKGAPSCVGTIPFGRARLADRAPEPMVGLWEGLVSFHFSFTYNHRFAQELIPGSVANGLRKISILRPPEAG